MIDVKVLGPGCDNCVRLESLACAAVAQLGVEAQVSKITDRARFKDYNLMATPGLVINEKLVSAGRIPSQAEIVSWLANALG